MKWLTMLGIIFVVAMIIMTAITSPEVSFNYGKAIAKSGVIATKWIFEKVKTAWVQIATMPVNQTKVS